MESQWIADRARLRLLRQQHPDWSKPRLAAELSYSLSWVKKWVRRLTAAEPDDDSVLFSRSRAPTQHQKLVSNCSSGVS